MNQQSELTKYLQAANDGPFVLHLQHQQGFKIRGFPVRILKSRKVYSGEWDWHSPPGLTLTLYIDEIKNTSLRLARKIARQTFEALNDDPSTPNEPLSLGKCQDLAALHKALLYKRYELYIPLQSPLSHPEVPSPAASILQSNDVFSGRARVSSKKPRPPRLIHEPSVPARLEGKIVSAFPDTGAAANFLNIRYARRHGFNAGNHTGESVKIGNGSLVEVLGTMILPFSFAEESKVHQVEFKVLTNCIHDVVLGSPFLKLTQTLIRFKERIQRRVRKVFTHNRICSLGSHQYVDGQLNGFDVSAVPDTGADVSVMSASFAKRRGFHVDTSERNRTVLEFADRSSATTVGVVKDMEWKYDSSFADRGDRLDVYVLKGLAEDLILSYDFLSATDAFLKYEDDFWTNEGEGEDEDELVIGRFFIIFIKFASKVLKRSTASGTDSSKAIPMLLYILILPTILTLHYQQRLSQTPTHTLPVPPLSGTIKKPRSYTSTARLNWKPSSCQMISGRLFSRRIWLAGIAFWRHDRRSLTLLLLRGALRRRQRRRQHRQGAPRGVGKSLHPRRRRHHPAMLLPHPRRRPY